MAYQLSIPDPYSTAQATASHTVLLTITLDMVAKTATGAYSTWKDKASRDALLPPIRSFTRTVAATALVNSTQTTADALVTGGQITELVGATVVA